MARSNRKFETDHRQTKASAQRPDLKIAGWTLLRAFEAYLIELLAVHGRESASEWVDQYHSPLGKRGHLEAVRSGELPGVKKGKRVFVRRTDLNEYLERAAVRRGEAGTEGETERSFGAHAVAARALEELGLENEVTR
ncbi:MAG TPA: helix-turn-helix domain-containing protein [Polyangiaceae bacterium]